MRLERSARFTFWALLLAMVVACAGGGPNLSTKEGERMLAKGMNKEAVAEFERLKALAPEKKEVRLGLGSAHFGLAEAALKAGDEETYISELATAQNETLRAIELNPEYAAAHNLLGVISASRSDLDAAQESFELARRLEPLNPTYYLNLAEVSVYRGRMTLARRYLVKARERGAPAPLIEINEVLAAWREGDYVEARDIFDDIVELNPQYANSLFDEPNGQSKEDANGQSKEGAPARVKTFEDFAQNCCKQNSCGPFMKAPCQQMKQQVAERTLREETRKKELQMEAERQKRSGQVSDRLRELQIEVDDLDSGPPPEAGDKEEAAPAKSKTKAKTPSKTKTQPR